PGVARSPLDRDPLHATSSIWRAWRIGYAPADWIGRGRGAEQRRRRSARERLVQQVAEALRELEVVRLTRGGEDLVGRELEGQAHQVALDQRREVVGHGLLLQVERGRPVDGAAARLRQLEQDRVQLALQDLGRAQVERGDEGLGVPAAAALLLGE